MTSDHARRGRVRRGLRSALGSTLCSLVLLAPIAGYARIVEEQAELPLKVTDAMGKTVEQPIRLTVFRDDAASTPQPLIVINHGRAVSARERAAMGSARYPDASLWFARQGFLVALPTRIGYGASGGDDVENSGPCDNKSYPPGFDAAAQQVVAVIALMHQRSDVLAGRTVVLGQSYGGATTVAVAALNPPGVVAAINFAGGSGGNPTGRPGQPCAANLLERTFADYGSHARVPMLWVYTENDRFFGATYPKEWFEAFRNAGGKAEFVQMPPVGDDGHTLFARYPALWQPVVADFLLRNGFGVKGDTEQRQ